jgi:hypothetical protein
VWEVVPRPEGKSVVTSRWLYKIKYVADGALRNTRLDLWREDSLRLRGLTMMRHSHQLRDILPSGVLWPLQQRWVGRSIRWM